MMIAAFPRYSLVLSCTFLLLAPLPAAAERYALLVGVSGYADEKIRLKGPQNDVPLVRDLLEEAGFDGAHVRVLADGVSGANGRPTRQAILDEMKNIAGKARRGDYVYLQFGGHGSRQPARAGKAQQEPDGLDEIFLPIDIGRWDGAVGSVQNAIRDEEMGEAINAIRARGAFVWAVFDACHSGNITRGASDGETVERKADPAALGIPQALLDRAEADAVTTRGGPAPKETALGGADNLEGGYVYFYAAQTTETTPEQRFAEGDPDRKSYGVFTYTLAQVVAQNPGISYRQAGERVLQLYAARNMRVTPMFEGSAIDAPVFGQKVGDTVRQWKVSSSADGLEIKAGSLQQFAPGAIFGVFQNAAAKSDSTPLGYLRASKVEVMRTQLVHTEYDGKKPLDSLPADAVVRLVNPNLNLNLRVALPASVPKGQHYALAKKVVDKLRNGGNDGLKVEWVASDKPADVRLILANGSATSTPPCVPLPVLATPNLWLVSTDGVWQKCGDAKTPSIQLDNKAEDELTAVLAGTLQSIAKAINLYRLANTGGKGLAGDSKLETHFYVTHAASGMREEMTGDKVPEVQAGDKLQIAVRSKSLKDMDITVLGIDARYGITLLYPSQSTDANRIHPRDSMTIPAEGQGEIVLDGSTVGRESILVIAIEAEPNSPTVNLGFLEQPSLSATRGGKQGQTTPVEDMFEGAGFGGGAATRGFRTAGAAAEKTTMKIYQYTAKAPPK